MLKQGELTKKPGEIVCLITGGAGFIGHHLARGLKNIFGCRTIIFDNLSNGTRANVEYADPDVFVEGDICVSTDVLNVFNSYSIDLVFHLAALPRVQFSVANPSLTNDVNVTGTLNLLIAARDAKVSRFVYSASSSAYGNQNKLPLVETMAPNPLSPYAAQKLMGEYYTRQFYQIWGMPTISLRYFNVYGPRQRADSDYAAAIPKFANQLLQGKRPTVFGDGEQTRDFTWVGDVVSANIASAFVEDREAYGRTYNIGGGSRVSVNQIITEIGKTLGIAPNPEYLPPVVESRHTLADISEAAKYLGWRPTLNFEEGLNRTVNSIREQYNVNP